MSTPFLGQIKIFAGNFAPKGYAFCNGQTLPINTNQALFSLLGTTYGGNGTTNFKLPNLQGTAVLQAGQGSGLSNYALGQTMGSETIALTSSSMPTHTHAVACTTAAGTTPSPSMALWAQAPATTNRSSPYSANAPDGTMAAGAVSSTGGGQAHSNIQPILVLNYIIALVGIYPARN